MASITPISDDRVVRIVVAPAFTRISAITSYGIRRTNLRLDLRWRWCVWVSCWRAWYNGFCGSHCYDSLHAANVCVDVITTASPADGVVCRGNARLNRLASAVLRLNSGNVADIASRTNKSSGIPLPPPISTIHAGRAGLTHLKPLIHEPTKHCRARGIVRYQ